MDYLFRPEAFESDFCLSGGYADKTDAQSSIPALTAPDLGRTREHYLEYIDNMADKDEPLWLGLSPKADRLIRSETISLFGGIVIVLAAYQIWKFVII